MIRITNEEFIWLEANYPFKKNSELAAQLPLTESTIATWASAFKWKKHISFRKHFCAMGARITNNKRWRSEK